MGGTDLGRWTSRFVKLIHGENGITPTKHEYGMYAAYSAGLRSACLSRQVGASIANKEGTVLATGCNDVPKAGGGSYSGKDGRQDHRCYTYRGGKCFNDAQKDELAQEIEDQISSHQVMRNVAQELAKGIHERPSLSGLPDADKFQFLKEAEDYLAEHKILQSQAAVLTKNIKKDTRLGGLIEFSRAVHAEMDALISIARNGNASVSGGTLYTTTYPCHSCARHIVAAGISCVYYIEPYEKSLALRLHDDSIAADVDSGDGVDKVRFLHFEGVSPRKYQEFFVPKWPRKKDGKAIFVEGSDPSKRIPQYLNSYIELESKVTAHITGDLKISPISFSEP